MKEERVSINKIDLISSTCPNITDLSLSEATGDNNEYENCIDQFDHLRNLQIANTNCAIVEKVS